MKFIIKEEYKTPYALTDLDYSEVQDSFVFAGNGIKTVVKGELLKEGKMKEKFIKIKYIKEENQLFESSSFIASDVNGNVYSNNGKNKNFKKLLITNDTMKIVDFNKRGNIIYYSSNNLGVIDVKTQATYSKRLKLEKQNVKIYSSLNNIALVLRKSRELSNEVKIFDYELNEVMAFKTEKNHIISKLYGNFYYGGREDGILEIINIETGERIEKNFEESITALEIKEEILIVGTKSGNIIINKDKRACHVGRIDRIILGESDLITVSFEEKIKKWEIVGEEYLSVDKFLETFKIHNSYKDFFTKELVEKIYLFISNLENTKDKFVPKKENIFKALEMDLKEIKVLLLGMDPYPQEKVATGLSFEVELESWSDKKVNTSLKNVLKLLYKTYKRKLKTIEEIRIDIEKSKFKIKKPSELFKDLSRQGVLFLNAALTTKLGKSGEHLYFWKDIITGLISFISEKNEDVIYLLWGKEAQKYESFIKSGKVIKHNHPAICGRLDKPNDFLNGKSFSSTKKIIDWRGIENE